MMPPPRELDARSASQMSRQEIRELLADHAERLYDEKEEKMGPENMRVVERLIMLRTLDSLWVDFLTDMEHMRRDIGLQAVGHINPLDAYRREGGILFQSLTSAIKHDVSHRIYHADLVKKESKPQQQPGESRQQQIQPEAAGDVSTFKHHISRAGGREPALEESNIAPGSFPPHRQMRPSR